MRVFIVVSFSRLKAEFVVLDCRFLLFVTWQLEKAMVVPQRIYFDWFDVTAD
jgi:hypothetical protein